MARKLPSPGAVAPLSSQTLAVRRLSPSEELSLPSALQAAAGFPGRDSWTQIARRIYDFPSYRLVAEQRSECLGLMALVLIRHPLFGTYLTTAPFASYGGFAGTSTAARLALLQAAADLGGALGAQYVNARFDLGEEPPPAGWIQQPLYATYRLALQPDLEAVLRSYASDHRNHVRKSLKKGFAIVFGGGELIDDAYEGLARSMHELGSPYHAKGYLRCMAESLGPALELAVCYSPRRAIVGAGVFIREGAEVTNLHANILRSFRADYAGEFLYWSAIARYAAQGLATFDLGRSLIGSGNETFKMKWRPQRLRLAYWYHLPRGGALPELHQKNAKFQLAIAAWKRLPDFIVRPCGPFLIKGLA